MTEQHAANRPAMQQLRERLDARFKLTEEAVPLPWSETTYQILLPASIDPLLDAAEADPEEQLPYWATIWPSGIALGDLLLQRRAHFANQRAIELGSGLGITATAALAIGMDLLVTDYSPETLLLCRLNTLRNAGAEPHTLQINWRRPSPALFQRAQPPVPLLLAADVLYEQRDIEPLFALIDRLLAPDGELWLAEPGRLTSQQFLRDAAARDWHDEPIIHAGPWPDPGDKKVVVHIHRLTRTTR